MDLSKAFNALGHDLLTTKGEGFYGNYGINEYEEIINQSETAGE